MFCVATQSLSEAMSSAKATKTNWLQCHAKIASSKHHTRGEQHVSQAALHATVLCLIFEQAAQPGYNSCNTVPACAWPAPRSNALKLCGLRRSGWWVQGASDWES